MRKFLFLISILFVLYSCNKMNNANTDNPFFSEFNTPNGTPPFDKIKAEHFMPAFEEALKIHAAEIDSIANNPEAPTFENTLVAMEQSGQMLHRVSAVFSALKGAKTDSIIKSIDQEINPKLTAHDDDIMLNAKLFARIQSVYNDSTRVDYTVEQKRLIGEYYKDFVRAGILLDTAQQTRLREINKELGLLSIDFGNNLQDETSTYQLVVEKQEDLAGLPDDIIAAAAQTAKNKGLEGKWLFTLNKTSWLPFLQYADNRDLREELYKGMYNRGDNGNAKDNKAIISKIMNLRIEKANMLGFKSYADFSLERTMAKTPENALKLLKDVWAYALPQAKKEEAELQALAKKEGQDIKIESWDWWYYAEKLRKEKYALDEEELKPYFKAENVRDGAFYVANQLYGISFKKIADLPVYNDDVQAFEVTDGDGSFIGVLYLDYYAREDGSKKVGAWMSSFRKQEVRDGKFIHPIIYNVGNFNPPTEDKPALLNADQVETLFHEFGHALHGLLSKCTYYSLSGTSVPRDFVELPSQVMEHWAFQPEVLKIYAKHYVTGDVISDELIEKMQKATYFNQGFATSEFVAAAYLDMKWHMATQKQDFDVRQFEMDAMKELGLPSSIIPRYRSTYFAHIFNGGYSAGYYSYMWAEVLDADAFNAFEAKGLFDQETAKSFRENVLSKGGTEDPMVLYKRFRGAEPNPIYLLKNRGFVK